MYIAINNTLTIKNCDIIYIKLKTYIKHMYIMCEENILK